MRLDHVSYAVSAGAFVPTLQRLGSALGASFSDGGVHPGFGTRNVVLGCTGGTYIEIVSPLDHPAVDRVPFGRAVKQRAEEGGGWLGWVVGVESLEPIEERIGRQAVEGHRILPSGERLSWHQIGVLDLLRDPQLPFFVSWSEESAHPGDAATSAVSVATLEIAGSPDAVDTWLGEPADEALDPIDVDWVDADEPGLVAVRFMTPSGIVRID